MRDTSCSRRPVWLSQCAFQCVDELIAELPGARFVRVVELVKSWRADLLELSGAMLMANPARELARLFEFLGERAPGRLRSCA